MSVLLVEGFETSADQPDVVKRGLLTASAITQTGCSVTAIPSRTGVTGTGLYLRGPYSASATLPCNAAGVADFGLLSLNQSVYSLWAAGGFSLGINASFNSLNTLQIAPGNTQQIVYDGAQYYWAITYNGAAYGVAYSTDLKNWTPAATAPASIAQNAYITVLGSGASATIVVSNDARLGTAPAPYYSTNLGATWTAMTDPSSAQRAVTAVTSSTAAFLSTGYSSGSKISYYTSASAAPVQLAFALAGTTTYYASYLVTTSGSNFIALGTFTNYGSPVAYPVTSGATSNIAWCATSNDPTVTGNWTGLPTLSGPQVNSVVYFNGVFLAAGGGGIWSCPKGGGSWTQVLNTSTADVWSIAMNSAGTIAVAVGTDPTNSSQGAIWTSTNGTAWTKQNRFILAGSTAASFNNFTNVFWDGARFIATGGLNNNCIATSTDGVAWNLVYVPDYAEQTGTSSMSFLGVFSGTQNPGTGVFTPWGTAAGNVSGVGLTASAVASSARTVTVATVTAGALANTGQSASVSAVGSSPGQQPPATLSHYYELVFTAVPGTPNLFNVQWALDNATMGTLGQIQMAATTDTGGAQLFLNLPRNGQWTVLDDIYLVNFAGSYHNARLGVQRIYWAIPSSDVQDNMTTSISGATNSATVATPLSNSEGNVSSGAITAEDIYHLSNNVPAGSAITAIQAEAFLGATGLGSGTGNVGILSSGVAKQSANAQLSVTPARSSMIAETDPNTSALWTISGLNALEVTVSKTS